MENFIGVSSVYNAAVVIAIIANKSFANQLMNHERKLHQVNAVICEGEFECPPDCPTDPCLCTEEGMSETCVEGTCHINGCDQCIDGYFKKDFNSLCVQCQETTGDSCIHCTDFLGCQQCIPGVPLVYAINCGIYVCADICGSTTGEQSPPTHFPSNDPTKNPTNEPTKQPTHNPTNNPTAIPTHSPTNTCFDSECENSPCSCTEVENCKSGTCHAGSGCNQCVNGYFKIDYDHHCIPCSVTGVGCKFCTDFLGCQQCKNGYSRVFDEECGIYICV